jgi:pectate lyase
MACTFLLVLSLFSECSGETDPAEKNDNDSDRKNEPALAFPGAEGFGKFTSGGREGEVVMVTNLNDSGTGSLRDAIDANTARTIMFTVSGNIQLKSPLVIRNGDVTIAGQSAPGAGICIRDYPLIIKADNVIIRYMRFRLGDESGQQDDAITCVRQKNVILDHCSMSWATDECASFYDNENFTLQWSIISESLNESVHEKGDHGYGGIWGGKGASFHHNLLAHHNSRLPRFCGSRYHKQPEKEIVDFRNNVIYNWKGNSSYAGEQGNHNMINNYYKAGPATTSNMKKKRILEPFSPYGKFFITGNYVDGFPDVTADNWSGGVYCDYPDSVKANMPFEVVSIKEETALSSYERVLALAGASLYRDNIDERIVDDVKKGTGNAGKNKNGIIDSQNDVGGWPELDGVSVAEDFDKDGIPDAWEEKNGLNPKSATDGKLFSLNKDYTNLEMYLNSLVSQ